MSETTIDGSPTTEEAALYQVRNSIAVITLNRPAALNAVNSALATAVGKGLEAAAADPRVRVVVVTGTGRAFCAGADLKELALQKPVDAVGHPEWGFAGIVRHRIDKPVIAAVNGYAMGGGTEIALACDLVVAADTAVFGLPEVKRGLLAAAGGVVRLQRQIPFKRAMEIALTGGPLDATTAQAWGLVNHVVPVDQVLDAAIALGEKVAANAPLSIAHTKRMVQRAHLGASDWDSDWCGEDPWALNAEATEAVFSSADAIEGPTAFAEKRAPVWQGR